VFEAGGGMYPPSPLDPPYIKTHLRVRGYKKIHGISSPFSSIEGEEGVERELRYEESGKEDKKQDGSIEIKRVLRGR
jgi:hypothetical protein